MAMTAPATNPRESRQGITRIVLVRHGQTVWNKDERFRGRADLDLTSPGMAQAQATARRLASWGIAAVYSSPLLRARRTAEAIAAAAGLVVQPLAGVIDIDYGAWQGLSLAEADSRDQNMYQLWLKHPECVRFPGGESLEDVRTRAVAALEQVTAAHPGVAVAVVSHKVVCKVLVCHVLGVDNSYFWRIDQDLCAVNAFEMRDGLLRASLINDTCHLAALATPDFKP